MRGLYRVSDLHYYAYNEWKLNIDTSATKQNAGVLAAGKVWRFNLGDPKPDAWTSTIERLQKQGFKFVHGDMKSAAKSSASSGVPGPPPIGA